MALTAGMLWEIRDTATTGNVNGAGFNPANASFPTDLVGATANTSAPVVTSATYTFVAGDVSAWIYVKAGTNWTPGFYQIASVATGAATLSAAVGAALQLDATMNRYVPNTVAGVATVASPTGGTYGVDYSQQNTAQTTATDFTAVGSSATMTSATAAFTPVMVGNVFHQTTTGVGAFGVAGWYEIVTYVNATTVTTDRTTNNGTASVGCTGFVGGAGRLNGLEDDFLEMIPGASRVFIKNGSYTLSGALAVSSNNSTAALVTRLVGYNALRGDTPTGAQRPVLIAGANSVVMGQFQYMYNLSWTTTASGGINSSNVAGGCYFYNCKIVSTSTTANRAAITFTGGSQQATNCEIISQNGNGVTIGGVSNGRIVGCYIHDCANGFNYAGSNSVVTDCLFECNTTAAITGSGASPLSSIINNTIYGREAKIGIGINMSAANSFGTRFQNNIIYGFATGALSTTAASESNESLYNDYFNNTTDVTLVYKSATDVALNPQFVGASQITGTTASGSGSVLTDTNADFSSVTDNIDFVHVLSGTGATLGCYLVTSHTTTTLTCNNAVGNNATADRVYFIGVGHNFSIGPNLKGLGFPGVVGGSETTGYMDIGAIQRFEPTLAATFIGV